MPLRNIVVIALAVVASLACYSVGTKNRYANLFAEALGVVTREGLMETTEQKLFDDSISGMLANFDRDTSYYYGADFRAFQEDIHQKFDGVGMHMDVDEEAQRLVVLAPVPGGPASEAGLRPGDEILSIDDKPVQPEKRAEAVALIRGATGTQVKIVVRREGQELTFQVPRQSIPTRSVYGDWMDATGKWSFVLQDQPRIGYLRIVQFGDNTSQEFLEALDEIADRVDSLIIDVRNNPGGLLPEVIRICDAFLPAGKVIVETRGREQRVKQRYESTGKMEVPSRLPVVILVDRHSASASEILAACLQDHGRATVIGERTYGKGTVQDFILLELRRSAMKLTTASYWRPSGRNIDRPSSLQHQHTDWGVSPDPGHAVRTSGLDLANLYRQRHLRDLSGILQGYGFQPKASYLLNKPILELTVTSERDSDEPDLPREPEPDLETPKSDVVKSEDRVLQHAIQFLNSWNPPQTP